MISDSEYCYGRIRGCDWSFDCGSVFDCGVQILTLKRTVEKIASAIFAAFKSEWTYLV